MSKKRKIKVFQVDSFTTRKFEGNPAGVVLDADGLSSDEMQRIATELNNSETAFILSPTDDDHEVWIRFFTPTMEVPTCGHATIAAHYIRAIEGQASPGVLMHKIGIGVLPVEIVSDNGDISVIMTQGKVEISDILDRDVTEEILSAFGISSSDLYENCPVQIVSTGGPKVMLGLQSSELLNSLEPSLPRLKEISKAINCPAYFSFTFDTGREDILTTARMFAPAIGINEDPVTGNGNGPLGAYLVHNRLVEHDGKEFRFRGEQGVAMGRPGYVDVVVEISDGEPEKVRISGRALTVFTTEISLDDII